MISQICPEEIRTANRRKELQKVRKAHLYQDRVKELISGKGCIICGARDHLLIHHTSEGDYKDPERYLQALEKGVVMCNSHHRKWHNGKTKTCPICEQELISPEVDRCWDCIPEEEKIRMETRRKSWNGIRNKMNQENYRKAKAAMGGIER